MHTLLGLDIGGTSMKLGAWRGKQRLAWREDIALPRSDSSSAACEGIAAEIRPLLAELGESPRALGIGSCGLIADGEIVYTPNTPWQSLPLAAELEARLALPVDLLNDADAFLIDALEGLAERQGLVIGITLGTGIGFAVWLGDRLLRGGSGISPEGGHIVLNCDGLPGVTGIPGSFEDMASSNALQRYYGRYGGDITAAPARIAELAQQGEGSAVGAWWRYGMALGTGLASLCNLFSPRLIVIGGGLSRSSALFIDALDESLSLYLLRGMPRPGLEFVGERSDAVAHGAALHALRRIENGELGQELGDG